MSQWYTDEYGNRRHKKNSRRRANPAYLYKYMVDMKLSDLIPFGGEELISIHTAKPKRKGSYMVGYIAKKGR